MKYKHSILAAFCVTASLATAGVTTTTVDKNPAPPPPPPDPCAGPISYNNVELLYAYTDWDNFGGDGDGGILRLEWSPIANLYFTIGAEYNDFDLGNIWTLHAGIGGYFPLTHNIHIAADAGVLYSDWEIDFDDIKVPTPVGDLVDDNDSDNDTGWYVRPHLRAKWGCLTVHAGALYSDVGNNDDFEQWSWFVNAYYQVAHNWDLTAGYRGGETADVFTAGVRWRY